MVAALTADGGASGIAAGIRARTSSEIPVERINGAVLLISGQDDTVWALSYMADQVVGRLRRHDFPAPP